MNVPAPPHGTPSVEDAVPAPPPQPMHQRYTVTSTPDPTSGPLGCRVTVWRHDPEGTAPQQVTDYRRDYSLFGTFAPFRQWRDGGWHEYALVSEHHDATSVLDLATGTIVATEELPEDGALQDSRGIPFGFCPMEFHVPDYATATPHQRRHRMDALTGRWALVGGCHWGDDRSVKVQYLDLSRVHEGVVARDDRFGYVELPAGIPLADAVDLTGRAGTVSLAVAVLFSLTDGTPTLTDLTREDYRSYRRPGDTLTIPHPTSSS